MALPAAIAKHVHISEREVAHTWPDGRKDDAAWEDCGYVSLIEFLRLAYRPDLPATHAFMETIRARVEGPSTGSLPSELIAAAETIGVSGPGTAPIVLKGYTASQVWAALKPGTVGCIPGSMGAFPDGYTLRRWDPGFKGRHQVMVARVDSTDRVWWCDPLAPTATSTGPFIGQFVSKTDFLKFVNAFQSTSFVAPIKGYVAPAPAPAPAPVVTYTQDQMNAAVAAAKTTAAEAATKAERERIALAEANRIRSL